MNEHFTISIIGRPNAGKSSLFNKILKQQKAIVAKKPGVTRDYQIEQVIWGDSRFQMVDTSGFEIKKNDILHDAISKQYQVILDKTDAFVFLCDGQAPITQLDHELLAKVRKLDKPTLYAVNKIDTNYYKHNEDEFFDFFGKKQFTKLCAEKGEGVQRLLRTFEKKWFLPKDDKSVAPHAIRVALMGRPNVGKSSLLNRLISQDRSIVSSIAGTTIDAIDCRLEINHQQFLFIDTAGLRKKRKISEKVEVLSSKAAIKTLERTDILLLCIDGVDGAREQDIKITKLAWQRGVAVIILINKWDLLPDDKKTNTYWQKHLWEKFRHFNRIPFLFVSALEQRNIEKIFTAITQTKAYYEQVIDAKRLSETFEEWTAKTTHPMIKKEKRRFRVTFFGIVQTKNCPPVFEVTTNYPKEMTPAYDRFLKNQLRETYGFWGIPIVLEYRLKKSRNRSRS